jgi:flagellar biosynthesis protein FlhF
MKIKRYVAPDMRQAMREVREEQGAEAVILSTRRIAEGIEIIAALDYDEALMREASRQGAARAPAEPPPPPPPVASIDPTTAPAPPAPVETAVPRAAVSPAAARRARAAATSAAAPAAPVAERAAAAPLIERAAQDTARLRNELGSMREMLEVQLSSLAWNDLERRQPLRARVLREMTRIGIEPDVARSLVDDLPEQINAEQARYLPLGMLSRRLAVSGRALADDAPMVTALVGPTGVGKTTTIAKLAARAVMRHGADQVALVSTDHYRIGAAAQLEHYGRLLGVRVYPAYDGDSLRKVLELLRDRHTVLIDTAGVASHDPRLNQQLDTLAQANELRATLVLAANSQPPVAEAPAPRAAVAPPPPRRPRVEPTPAAPVAARAAAAPLMERAAQDTARLRNELGSMREMLEVQLSSLAWNDLERRQPLRARVLREMTRIGIEPDVARLLVDDLPEQINAEQARYLPLGMLSRRLAVSGRALADDAPMVTALVGPTGVGKTTTIAKLAARAVMRHGADQVALVSTDHYRIGAAAQLEHYGRLLGVRVYPAYDGDSLRKVLELLRDRHTVLIDTAGVASHDPRLNQQLDTLAQANELRATLVLAANTHAQSLDDAVRAYLPLQPQACILTKLDEAPNLGGALSVLIRRRLALDYTTDGQRVPEDISVADARVLVCRAAQSLKTGIPDDSLMADRFGLAVASA